MVLLLEVHVGRGVSWAGVAVSLGVDVDDRTDMTKDRGEKITVIKNLQRACYKESLEGMAYIIN